MRELLRGILSGVSFLAGISYARLFLDYCKEPMDRFLTMLQGGIVENYVMEPMPSSYIVSFIVLLLLAALFGMLLRDMPHRR